MTLWVSLLALAWSITALVRIRTVDRYLKWLILKYDEAQRQEIKEMGLFLEAGNHIDWSGYDKFHKLFGEAVDREIRRAWSYSWSIWRSKEQLYAPGVEIVRQAEARLIDVVTERLIGGVTL